MRRQWRVGTWSMGAALAGMGVLLILSHFNGLQGLDQGLLWWPLLLVVLGAEIMVYLWRSQDDQPVLRYDLFSIVFIALIGMFSIVLTTVNASGVFTEIRGLISAKEVQVDAETLKVSIAGIDRIVVKGDPYWNGMLEIDAGRKGLDEVHAFGTCHFEVGRDEKAPDAVEVVTSNVVGDTLYVQMKRPERTRMLMEQHVPTCSLMLVMPSDKKVEITQNINVSLAADSKLPESWRFVERRK